MATTNTATNITSLPTELVQAVARDMNGNDLLNLRLTCRDISVKVDDVFIDTFFIKRRHLITTYSLKTLVEICGVTRLRRRLQSLEFVAAELSEPSCKPRRNFSDFSEKHLYWFMCGKDSQKLSDAEKHEIENVEKNKIIQEQDSRGKVWGRWVAERKRLHEDGLAVDLISEALTSLARAGIVPSISINSDTSASRAFRPYEFKRIRHDLAVTEIGPWDENHTFEGPSPYSKHSDSTVSCLLEAVAMAAYSTKELTLLSDDETFSLACFNLDDALLSGLQFAFSSLTTLELSIDSFPIRREPHTLSGFASVMKAAVSLRSLALVFCCESVDEREPPERDMAYLAEALPENQLESIHVFSGKFHAQDLLTLFERQSKSLKKLGITSTCMHEIEQWRTVLRWLASELSLEEVSMEWLHLVDWTWRLKEEQELGISGVDAVKEGLENLAQTAVFDLEDWAEQET